MEPNLNESIAPIINPTISVCLVCHQPLLPQYYFCPNCGARVDGKEAPLDTTYWAKSKIYVLSVIQPTFLFLLYHWWHGIKYYKSTDPKAHRIGQIAWALLIFSTILNIWVWYATIVMIPKLIQSYQTYLNDSINSDFPGL
jgi:predicted amidophosphoribosyltransferase